MNEATPMERVKLARHPQRPYTLDLLEHLFTDFYELHGDRRYAEDAAVVAGCARLGETEVLVIGQQKGRDTKQRHQRNFGMPKPEGYRKALRLMQFAEKFRRPIITLIDTPGAYPGIDAEERGQAEAIAFNLREASSLTVPLIAVVIGEGGSGGALAIGVADHVAMLENSVYSVISPEGCAAILWKDAGQAERAAANLKLTAQDLLRLRVIDEVIPEPAEWLTLNAETASRALHPLKISLSKNLTRLQNLSADELLERRWQKFREIGRWLEQTTSV